MVSFSTFPLIPSFRRNFITLNSASNTKKEDSVFAGYFQGTPLLFLLSKDGLVRDNLAMA